MVRRDGAEARKERIDMIARSIQAALNAAKQQGSDFIPLKRTLALLMRQTGLTKEKLMEYLEILQDDGSFIIDQERDQIRKPELES